MKAILRLAIRDTLTHRGRTLFTIVLTALPMIAVLCLVGISSANPPAAAQALNSLPPQAQARLIATAVPRTQAPLKQTVDNLGIWFNSDSQTPADDREIQKTLPDLNLKQYWYADQALIMHTSSQSNTLQPGQTSLAENLNPGIAKLGNRQLQMGSIIEANTDTLKLIEANPMRGHFPSNSSEVMVSSKLAQQLQLQTGDILTVVFPPDNGWKSVDTSYNAVVGNQLKVYRVSGICQTLPSARVGAASLYALPGWIKNLTQAHPQGIDYHFLSLSPISWEQVQKLNQINVLALSRQALNQIPTPGIFSQLTSLAAINSKLLATSIFIFLIGIMVIFVFVTSTFQISLEQQRRLLALIGASGASSKQIKLLVLCEGAIIGGISALVGFGFGMLSTVILTALLGRSPWQTLTYYPYSVALLTGTLMPFIGIFATFLPARWATRQDVSLILSPINHLQPKLTSHESRLSPTRKFLLTPILLTACILSGIAAFLCPTSIPQVNPSITKPTTGLNSLPTASPTPFWDYLSMTLITVSLLLFIYLTYRLTYTLIIPILGKWATLAGRLAYKDAAFQLTRTKAILKASLAAIILISFSAVLIDNIGHSDTEKTLSFNNDKQLTLAMKAAVSNSFDRGVLNAAESHLNRVFPDLTSYPIYSFSRSGIQLLPQPPVGHSCPTEYSPDIASILGYSDNIRCIDQHYNQSLQLRNPDWSLSADSYIMDGKTLAATGIPEGKNAAELLDRGIVMVADKTLIKDGKITLVITKTNANGAKKTETRVFPAHFIRNLGGLLVMHPASAKEIGLHQPRLNLLLLSLDSAPYFWQIWRAESILAEQTPLVVLASPTPSWRYEILPYIFIICGGLGILTVIFAARLSCIQARPVMQAIHISGASPAFIRKFVAYLVMLPLLIALPVGCLGGNLIAYVFLFWLRHLGDYTNFITLTFSPELQLVPFALIACFSLPLAFLNRDFLGRK